MGGYRESCDESASFSFTINGSHRCLVYPSWGLQQGYPMLPYQFFSITKGLIRLLRHAEYERIIQGHMICNDQPSISHSLFAGDSIFFCNANKEQAHVIKDVLRRYKAASRSKWSLLREWCNSGRIRSSWNWIIKRCYHRINIWASPLIYVDALRRRLWSY